MGSIDLETANMYSEDEDDFPPVPTDLPPLSPTREDQDPMANGQGPFDDIPQGDGGEDGATEGDQKPKRMVRRNPQPKMDPARLTSERGLPTLVKRFDKMKFKGKGHEVSDLNNLMMAMEHWGNRLFPKMTFDEIIERIEKLGRKKPVQVCLTKIRLNMPLLDEDFVEREGEEDGVARGESDPDEDEPLPDLPGVAPGNVSYGNLDISDDQKKRMEENKRKAMEKRAARMQSSQNTTGISVDEIPDVSQTKVTNDGIDSDEEDLENEMWNDLITSQQTSTQRPNGNHSKDEISKKPSVADVDSDKSGVQCPEYDEETDDDDDYEEYLAKLKATKLKLSMKEGNSVADKTFSSLSLDDNDKTVSSLSLDDNEQSLSILADGPPAENDTISNDQDGGEQSQSILGESTNSEPSCKNTEEKDTSKGECSSSSQKEQSLADKGLAPVSPEKVIEDDTQDEETQDPDVGLGGDEEATCLPEDTQGDEGNTGVTLQGDDEATCLPEEYTEDCGDENMADVETQLPEQDTVAMVETQLTTQDTVAMATEEQDGNGPVDTAEAETMEYEDMDTAEAETEEFK